MVYRVSQDGWVIMKCADNKWSTRGRNGNQLQYSCLENIINSKKRKKDMTLQEEPPRSEGIQYANLGKSGGQLQQLQREKSGWAKAEMMLYCECVWW